MKQEIAGEEANQFCHCLFCCRILYLQEMGFTDKRAYLPKVNHCLKYDQDPLINDSQKQRLGFRQLISPFLLFIGGIGVSLVIFIYELVAHRRTKVMNQVQPVWIEVNDREIN